MKLLGKKMGSWGFFTIEGSVDSPMTKCFTEHFAAFVDGSFLNMIINVEKSPFLSIGAIRYLNRVAEQFKKQGGRIFIVGLNDRIRKHVDIFVSWSTLKELAHIWEVIPFKMGPQIEAAPLAIFYDESDPNQNSSSKHPVKTFEPFY